MNESDVTEVLSLHFRPPVWAFLPQVRNGTGWAKQIPRTADALAMCLWPSRGIALHGIEIKVSRSDWLAELKNPAKAEDFFNVCDRWWVAAPKPVCDDIVKKGELPSTWGLLKCEDKVKVVTPAPPLKPKPMDNLMLAAIMRRLQECASPEAALKDAEARSYEKGREDGQKQSAFDLKIARGEAERFCKIIQEFEGASGVKIANWAPNVGQIGAAVKAVLDGEDVRVRERLEGLRGQTENILASIDKALKIESMVEKAPPTG